MLASVKFLFLYTTQQIYGLQAKMHKKIYEGLMKEDANQQLFCI